VLWWKQGTLSFRQVALAAPMLLLAVPLGLHTAYLERHQVGAVGPDWDFSLIERCLIAGRAVWFYAGKLVVPYPLIFMYPRWEIDAGDWRQYLFPISAVGLVAGLLLLLKRIGRGPLAAALFFGGTLFPALGFFNVYPMKFSFVADHFQYAASIGLIVLFVAAGAAGVARYGISHTGQLLGAGLLVLLAILTWRQCLIYWDQETLWRDTLAKNPECKMAYINLGTWLRSEGQLPEAALAFAGAVKLRPSDPDGHIGLAMTHAELQDLDRAESILRKAISLDPDYAMTYGNLADVMYRRERFDDAAALFQRALALDEKNILIRYNYGNLLLKQRKWDEAQRQYERVLERSPDFVAVRENLAILHWERGQWTAAAEQFRAVLEIDPDYPDAREFLEAAEANAKLKVGPPQERVK
ncbi:MAG TPA: tetratricopeptide repeat protein, partial [Pirellulaceae bacterium]|nr:tetratricopeptide repeat protein [Pirellulaceae bacterium]